MPDPHNIQTASFRPGDVLVVETPSGPAHVQVTHARAPYPDVIRAIRTDGPAEQPNDVAAAPTAFVAMVELANANAQDRSQVRLLGNAPVPQQHRTHPRFQTAIRNRAGETVYWWAWDGQGLSITTLEDAELPKREVLSVARLIARLQSVGA